ncbi:MAG TPA: carbamoyl-phosphate synthase large subunit, partial [Afifellaceae bacterium]|nr:carbamoyl-phosphate synthase large subunit [Afifellaceae bacterium]
RQIKGMGFSDARLAMLTGSPEDEIRARRHAQDVHPVYKRIDTCAAEFQATTAYMYSTYEEPFAGQPACEAEPSDRKKVMILGGGPNRIGQGIEFDYCCCHAAFALDDAGYESIMVNCNPETVSTDYDTSDRLYFEPLTIEDVLEIIAVEQSRGTLHGVIVQFGGQTPLKLADGLQQAGVPILGTSPDMIDLAEDRDRFKALIEELGLRQPNNGIARSSEQARAIAEEIGYPVVIRPSYVLGGRAMEIVRDTPQLERYINEAVVVSGTSPVLIDSYLSDAIEVDVDALCDGRDVFICGVMEHIEEAGIHSGDSACSLPPHSLSDDVVARMKTQTEALAKALNVGGLMNVQYAVKDDEIYLLEVNPRASRTVPFVAKAVGIPIAKIAARIMAGETLESFKLENRSFDHVAVKEAVFPFARFPGVDTVLGPEMRSTGEVMGIDDQFPVAFAKSQIGAGSQIPQSGRVFISVRDSDKPSMLEVARKLTDLGFQIVATGGTCQFLNEQGVACERINKVLEGQPHIVDAIKNGNIQLVFNTTEGARALADSRSLRQAALLHKIPYYTTLSGARAAALGIEALVAGQFQVRPLQSYFTAA